MRELKSLIQDIYKGKNLESNLKRYKDMAVRIYNDYAALELTMSGYVLLQEALEEKPELAAKEKKMIDSICRALGSLAEEDCDYAGIISEISGIRQEITDKMDLLTAYTDRLLCYEYVLNRMEFTYMPEKELDERFADVEEEDVLREIMGYIFSDEDTGAIQDKLNIVIGQIPVHMTKSKLFEKIRETATIYKGGDKSSLDSFFYMLRTSSMLHKPQKYVDEYPDIRKVLERLTNTDYKTVEKAEYEQLKELEEKGGQALYDLTDFYYTMQRVVNRIYALCLSLPYESAESRDVRESKEIWRHLAKQEYEDEMLVPLEGRIEKYVEQSGYLESVLFEIENSYKKELDKMGLEKFIKDCVLVSKLLSDSLFIDLDKEMAEETADAAYVQELTESFLQELSDQLSFVSRPIKKAIMGRILESLPKLFQSTEEIEEYIRVNLFGCQNKAEKYIVMAILRDVMEQEW